MTPYNEESAKKILWHNQIWMQREELRLLLENYLLNKICWSEFSLDFYKLIKKINTSTRYSWAYWEKEIKSVNLNPKVAVLADYIQELSFMDEVCSELLCEEEETANFDLILTYRDIAYGLYKSLLIAYEEENVFLKDVLVLDQQRILQETMLFFSFATATAYSVLNPTIFDLVWQ